MSEMVTVGTMCCPWVSLFNSSTNSSIFSQGSLKPLPAQHFGGCETLSGECGNSQKIPKYRRTLVSKVMSVLLNMLSRLVITFLPRSKCLFISWLESPSALILEPPKIKSAIVSTVSPSICHEVMELDAMILVFSMLNFKL